MSTVHVRHDRRLDEEVDRRQLERARREHLLERQLDGLRRLLLERGARVDDDRLERPLRASRRAALRLPRVAEGRDVRGRPRRRRPRTSVKTIDGHLDGGLGFASGRLKAAERGRSPRGETAPARRVTPAPAPPRALAPPPLSRLGGGGDRVLDRAWRSLALFLARRVSGSSRFFRTASSARPRKLRLERAGRRQVEAPRLERPPHRGSTRARGQDRVGRLGLFDVGEARDPLGLVPVALDLARGAPRVGHVARAVRGAARPFRAEPAEPVHQRDERERRARDEEEPEAREAHEE